MTKEREIFIPIGKGIRSEVYVDGVACVAQFVNLGSISRLQSPQGQTEGFTGEQMRSIIAKDERNHKYYKDYIEKIKVSPSADKTETATRTGKLETIDYNTLMSQAYAPLKFQVAEILPQGLFILAGAPKIGKSWLVLDICCSISASTPLWGHSTTRNGVLYIALEDNHRRLQDRLKKIATDESTAEPLNLHLAVSAKGIHDGLVEQVDEFMKEHPDTGFITIDTLEHIRKGDTDRKERGLYSADYSDMQILRTITNKYDGITLMLIHHTRKMYDADPLFTVTGSTGLTGAVDGIWVLDKEKRAENKAILSILNRDTKSYAFKLQLDEENCKWQFMGEHGTDENEVVEKLSTAINRLFTETDLFGASEWKGNATALCTALHKIDDSLSITERTIKGKLKNRDLQDLLKKKFGIAYKYQEFGRMIIFTKSNHR
jgi:hypothetical protein